MAFFTEPFGDIGTGCLIVLNHQNLHGLFHHVLMAPGGTVSVSPRISELCDLLVTVIIVVDVDSHRAFGHGVEHVPLGPISHHDFEFHDAGALGFSVEFGFDDLAARLGFDVCHDSGHFGIGAEELRQLFCVFGVRTGRGVGQRTGENRQANQAGRRSECDLVPFHGVVSLVSGRDHPVR